MKKTLLLYFWCIVAYLSTSLAYSQSYTYDIRSFGVKDGLIHRNVNCIFEDKDGFIWTGYNKGFQRFDGYEFKTWSQTIHHHKLENITIITQDDQGWLWFWNNTVHEFVFFNPITEEFLEQSERFGDDFPVVFRNDISGWTAARRVVHVTPSGKLLFLSSKPSELITFSNGKFDHIPFPALKSDFLELHLIDESGHLWITDEMASSRLYKTDMKGNVIHQWDFTNSYDITQFSEKSGKIYFNVNYKKANNKITTALQCITGTVNKEVVESSLKLNCWHFGQSIWRFGAEYFEVSKGEFDSPLLKIPADELPKGILSLPNDWMEDRYGRFWIVSRLGLVQVTVGEEKFQRFFSFSERSEKPIGNAARGMAIKGDTLFANFEFGGLVAFNRKQPQQYEILVENPIYQGRPLVRMGEHHLFSGLKNAVMSLDVFGEPSGIFSSEELIPTNTLLWSFFLDEKQCLWMGSDKGLLYLSNDQQRLLDIPAENQQIIQDCDAKEIYHITPNKDGQLWLSGASGLFLFDPDRKSFLKRFHNGAEEGLFLPSTTFYYTYIDLEGIYWLGTADGLIRWDRVNNDYRIFTTFDGLSNNVVYAVIEDDHGKLWLSSDYGIMQFDKETFKVSSYLIKDGISHEEFNKTSVLKADDGTIYFGGLNGITAFHPDDFYDSGEQLSYSLVISDFEIYDGVLGKLLNKTGEILQTKSLQFHPSDRFFRLKFALLTMTDIERNAYAWKIEGVDEDWQYQKENSLQIGKLPYGEQILRIKGQSANGQWSPNELSIRIQVLKPFYLTGWFLITSLLVLVVAITSFYKARTRLLKREINKATATIAKQTEALRALDQLKSRFFANVSHELRTPLSLMLGPIKRLIRNNGQEVESRKLLDFLERNTIHLRSLVNEILDLSKLENNKMEVREEATVFYRFINQHLQQFYSIGYSESVEVISKLVVSKHLVILLDQNKFEKIINNFLSNAIKFSPICGKVVVKVEEQVDSILLEVNDHGRGIHPDDLPYVFDRFFQSKAVDSPAEGGTGIGLSMCKELAKLMNGEVWAESRLGEGSSFFFRLPKKIAEQTVDELADEVTLKKAEKYIQTAGLIPSNGTTHKAKILIAEDNQDLQEYYKMILSDYEVVTTNNGREALDYLANNKAPNLIISDFMMPVMDGMQFINEVKSSDQWWHIPFIMLTAKTNQQAKIKALRYGIDDYLNKPFDDDELLVRIHNLLHNQQEWRTFQNVKTGTNPTDKASKEELQWLEDIENYIIENIESDLLSVGNIAYDFAVSESTLLRQLKKLTGLTPVKYVQELKLNHAKELIINRDYSTISQVAYKIGFKDPKSFSRSFRTRFGKSPREYADV